ncbi:MAG: carboxypeptidase-like regulatory domain-containing protein [Bacteroidota bacterium]
MKKNYIFLFLFLSSSFQVFSQAKILGIIKDAETGEELIGVNILSAEGGTVSDYDGSYVLPLPTGEHEITFSYVGYETTVHKISIVGKRDVIFDLKMSGGQILKQINVVADIALERKTPVAFSNIPTVKLQEELAAQDIPMILNSTPGAYATQAGGGDGDARITIRGFDQRNVAVMLDGIPVNDMENGRVFWSNWFGLDLVTKTMQVQRGLGASKLAIPSVGGTINILTKGIDAKPGGSFRQEYGNNGFLRSTFGLTTGRINGWGLSIAGSYKRGDGWVDGTFTEGYFYYLRLDRQMGKHLFSFSGFGAPQEHGQRPFTQAIAKYDADIALELGVPMDKIDPLANLADNGMRYNEYYGNLNGEFANSSVNYYHKPQISARHSWQANDKFFLSNVAYLSIGNGGGARVNRRIYDENGQMDLTKMYAQNVTPSIFKEEGLSDFFLRSSVNNHFWYGLLSTFKYDVDKNITISGGIDLRQYRGEHYRTPYDLLGGEFIYSDRNSRVLNRETRIEEGDIFSYHYDGFVRWAGTFGLVEYTKDKLSVFLNFSTAVTGYKMVDYLWDKEVTVNGEKRFVGYYNENGDADILERVVVDGNTMYTVENPSAATLAYAEANNLTIDSETPQNQSLGYILKPTFTVKTGAVYNFNKQQNLFANVGYFSRAPRYNNVNNRLYTERIVVFDEITGEQIGIVEEAGKIVEATNTENEEVYAVELGYGFKSRIFAANLNTYYTVWNNKPLDRLPTVLEDPTDPESARIPVNISGIEGLHMGVELDFAFKLNSMLTVEGLASIGDWRWNSSATTLLPNGATYAFDAKGVRVGDAAQTQFGGMIRVEPIKGLYMKLRGTYFGKNFANFDPESLQGDDAGRQSWQMPDYYLFDFHTGYRFRVNRLKCSIRLSVLNILDEIYITDARNNDNFVESNNFGFNAQSASVHFGQGRRWNSGLTINF